MVAQDEFQCFDFRRQNSVWDAVQTHVSKLTFPHTVSVEKVTAAAAAADSISQAADHSPPVPLPSNVLCALQDSH